jgi:hypothetical protein
VLSISKIKKLKNKITKIAGESAGVLHLLSARGIDSMASGDRAVRERVSTNGTKKKKKRRECCCTSTAKSS